MMARYPAACPGCGAPAVDVLLTDPSVPIYACAWYASSPRPCAFAPQPRTVDRNVVPLELDDELAIVLLGWGLAEAIVHLEDRHVARRS